MKKTTANFTNNQQEKIMTAAHKLLAMFQSGEFPEMAKRSILMKAYNSSAPSANWSIGNIITMLLAGTEDARGFKQWEKAGVPFNHGVLLFLLTYTSELDREKCESVQFVIDKYHHYLPMIQQAEKEVFFI